MDYQQTVNWLFDQLPVYQVDGVFKYKVDLKPIIRVCNHLDNPQNNFKSIHVAGTNGKGSSSHMISSVLQEAGYSVGLYTSPHLKDFRERIKLNGKKVDKKFVVDFVEKNKDFFLTNKISFFEMTVAMAFKFFSKSKVDVAVIETGLGGRLDATNIIKPLISLITNIGLDHKEFLGDSLTEIAMEKAGIIKNEVPVVISQYQREVFSVFEETAKNLNSNIFLSDNNTKFKSDLKGNFQNKNISGVLKVLSLLKEFEFSDSIIKNGLLNVVKNTGLIGRFQVINKEPLVICDVGHNIEAFNEIYSHIKSIKHQKLRLVLGFVKGKDFKKILDLFPKSAEFYFCSPNISRGLDIKELKKYSKVNKLNSTFYNNVKDAYKCALFNCNKNDLLFIGGSNFVVAEIL
jgi:dihydrofolate synthase/folylpolyglutamate synthase